MIRFKINFNGFVYKIEDAICITDEVIATQQCCYKILRRYHNI